MAFEYDVPDYKKIRVIVDTDAACETDDPFAIAHALLSPKLIVRGIIAEHFKVPGSMQKSYDEIETILDAMDLKVPVYHGQDGPLCQDKEISEAVDFIIKEAKREEERKHKKEVEGRRNRLRKLYYEQVPPISFHIPPHSSLLNMDDEE